MPAYVVDRRRREAVLCEVWTCSAKKCDEEGGLMSINDLRVDNVYTDNQGRFRKIISFFDGFDGERRVQYEAGYIQPWDG